MNYSKEQYHSTTLFLLMFTKALREVLPGDLQRNESSFPQTLSQMAALVYASALTTQ